MPRKRRGRGEGSIYQEADGRWTASVSFGYDGKGKRRRRKVRGKTKGEVQARLAALRQRGGQGGGGRLSVAAAVAEWIAGQHGRGALGDTSKARYGSLLRTHLEQF